MSALAFTIKSSDIARCRKRSLSALHYYPTGECRCGERSLAQREVDQARQDLSAASMRLARAQVWLQAT